jgi:hypothetical protein
MREESASNGKHQASKSKLQGNREVNFKPQYSNFREATSLMFQTLTLTAPFFDV